MIERTPADDERRFADIMSSFGYFSRERGDPLIDDIFSEILNAETTLNTQTEALDADNMRELTELLNSLFVNRGLANTDMLLAGRLRPSATLLQPNGQLRADVSTAIHDLGPLLHDQAGAYFAVSNETLRYNRLSLETSAATDPLGNTTTRYAVLMHFAPDDSPSSQLYAYPEDLDTCAPEVASDEKIERILHTEYPEIAGQIDAQLPAGCGNDRKIMRALADFRLALDWNQYPNVKVLEKSELYDYLSRYITARVQFDKSMYGLKVRDHYLSINAEGNIITVRLPEPIIVYAGIDMVQLIETEPVAGVPTYGALITARAPSNQRGGGSYMLHIPAGNVPGIRALRNEALAAGDEMPENLPDISANILEPLPDTKPPAIDYAARIHAREYELIRLEKWWQDLLANVQNVMAKTYTSERKAKKAAEEVQAIVRAAGRDYPSDFSTVIEAYGEGVIGVSPEVIEDESGYDPDEDTTTVVFKNVRPTSNTIATPRRGIYTRSGTTVLRETEDEPALHKVESYLAFNDIDADRTPLGILPVDTFIRFYALHPQHQFAVKLDATASHITIPELEHLRDCRQAIETIEHEYPTLPELPAHLTELQYQVASADPTTYTDISDVNILRSMGKSVAGNKAACADVMTALTAILKGAPVQVSGPIYRLNGELEDTQTIHGVIEGAVSIVGETDTDEPLLVVASSRTERWYVPLSAIEQCKF